MANPDVLKEQMEIAERLQLKWLRRMEVMIDEGIISATDMATLRKFLSDNGWNIDRTKLPEGLMDKITERVAFDEDDDGEVQLRVIA